MSDISTFDLVEVRAYAHVRNRLQQLERHMMSEASGFEMGQVYLHDEPVLDHLP